VWIGNSWKQNSEKTNFYKDFFFKLQEQKVTAGIFFDEFVWKTQQANFEQAQTKL